MTLGSRPLLVDQATPLNLKQEALKVVASHPEIPNNTLSQKITKKKKGVKTAHSQTTGLTVSTLKHLKNLSQ